MVANWLEQVGHDIQLVRALNFTTGFSPEVVTIDIKGPRASTLLTMAH